MFGLLHGLYLYWFSKKEHYVLILGPDNAGKTTLLERLKVIYGDKKEALPPDRIAPTVGLNIGRLDTGREKLVFWDLGGQSGLRSIWEKYYAEAHAIIYVVDSAESEERLRETKEVFETVMLSKLIKPKVPVLVFLNKQDLLEAQNVKQMAELFDLSRTATSHPCIIQPICALNGDGIEEGVRWLIDCVRTAVEEEATA